LNEITDKTPKRHGEVFFQPAFSQWKEEALRNRERLVKQIVWGQSALKVREVFKLPTDQPLVMSGHQPVFFHPGLWAKCLAASTLAESISGTAIHKITDTALAPEHLHYVPEIEDNGKSRRKQIDFFATKDMKNQEKTIPYSNLPAPEFAALEKIFSDAQVYCSPVVRNCIRSWEPKLTKGLKKDATWYDFHLSTLRTLDEVCGTHRLFMQGSKVWASEPFTHFAASWLSNLAELTECYNGSLTAYRTKYDIKHELTPMPNLKFENWWFEIPFWGVTKYQQRHSLWAKKEGKHLLIRIKGGETYTLDYDNLHGQLGTIAISLWPKAIPQTLFCRLYLCDFFIHGTGGAAYEEVGDMILNKVFNVKPPAFGVVSATYLVEPKESKGIDMIVDHVEKIQWWQRALEQNPEYLFMRFTSWQKELPGFMHPAFIKCYNDESLRKLALEKDRLVKLLQDPAPGFRADQEGQFRPL